jgi:hypothetical protein
VVRLSEEFRKVASADYQLAPNERPILIVIMPLSSPENWKDKDCVNDDIWSCSPGLQMELAAQFPVGAAGNVGGQQAMFDTPNDPNPLGTVANPLPWVPDLVGKNSDAANAVMIIGSAYAPFVEGYCGRDHTMPLSSYRAAQCWNDFLYAPQIGFLSCVVNGDHRYYDRISRMLNPGGGIFDFGRLILTDWCRASFGTFKNQFEERLDIRSSLKH